MALTDNILAYWKLDDDGSGGVSLVDSTGNGYTLTNSGTTLGTGIIGGAAFSDYGRHLTFDAISLDADFTISGWIKQDDGDGSDQKVFWGSPTSSAFFASTATSRSEIWLGRNGIGESSGLGVYSCPTALSLSDWYLVTVVRDSGAISVFINGDSCSGSTSNTDTIVFDGLAYVGSGDSYNWYGGLDETGVWNRALSQADVTALYNSGAGSTYPFTLLYYNAAVNTDWGTLGNWWQDSGFTIQATDLPDNTNPVYIYGDVVENTAGDGVCYCNSAEFYSASFYSPLVLNTTGLVNFQGTGGVFDGTCTDGISFHDTCSLGENGVVQGDATFRDSSTNSYGTINGNAFFYESSYNYGQIDGNATVYYSGGDGSYPIGGTVTGSVTYPGWPAVTLQYFNDQVEGSGASGNWQDKNNWWANSEFTTRPINPEGTQELPDAGTTIYVYGTGIHAYTDNGTISVNNAEFYSGYLASPLTLNCSVNSKFFNNSGIEGIAYGDCYFYNNSYFYTGAGTGFLHQNVYLYDNSGIYSDGTYAYNIAGGGLYFNSLDSMKNTISYHFGAQSDGCVFNIPSGGGGMISRLLNLPWFINI